MKELTERKYNGQTILVFPTGTRFRPWEPESKKGVREIFTYLKSFDNILFLGINGNLMKPHKSEDMNADIKNIERLHAHIKFLWPVIFSYLTISTLSKVV